MYCRIFHFRLFQLRVRTKPPSCHSSLDCFFRGCKLNYIISLMCFCFQLIDIDLYIHQGDSDKGTLPLIHLLLFLMNLLVSWSWSFGMTSLVTLNLRNLHSFDSLWSSIQNIWITYRFLCIPNSHEGSNSKPDHAYADSCFPVHEILNVLLFAWVFSIDLKWHNEFTFMFSLNLSFYLSS